MKKILINISNINVGGGIQVALSLIEKFTTDYSDTFEFHILSTRKLYEQVFSHLNKHYFSFVDESPAKILSRALILKKMDEIELLFRPDLIFTVFGPSYWRSNQIQLTGFALGWITNPRSVAFKQLSLLSKIKRICDSAYKWYYIKRDSFHLIGETNDVKNKLIRLGYPKNKISVIGNTCSSYFYVDKYNAYRESLFSNNQNNYCFLSIGNNYPHKNFKLIRDVLNTGKLFENIKFYVTMNISDYNKLFSGFENRVCNLGVIHPKNVPYVFSKVNALFLPTLLESFSASYPEAMYSGKPIVTTRLDFALDLCGEAALYFSPFNLSEVIEHLNELSQNKSLSDLLIKKGYERFAFFETADTRAEKYISTFNEILKKR